MGIIIAIIIQVTRELSESAILDASRGAGQGMVSKGAGLISHFMKGVIFVFLFFVLIEIWAKQ